jgi:hypothetical protein
MDIVVYTQICALTPLNCTMALKIKIAHSRVGDVAIDNRSRSAIPPVRVISKYDSFRKRNIVGKFGGILTQLVQLLGRKQHDV